MSRLLTLEISDDAFGALEREAAAVGVSPANLLRVSVEQVYGFTHRQASGQKTLAGAAIGAVAGGPVGIVAGGAIGAVAGGAAGIVAIGAVAGGAAGIVAGGAIGAVAGGAVGESVNPTVEEKTLGLAAEVAKANQDRVDLLVRKAKGASFSSEDERRLAALSERVQQLLPRATREDFSVLSEMRSRAEERESLARQVRSKYRLGDAD